MLVDFEALGAVPKDRLRQATAASICLKTAPSKADTLLPEDHHYQVCHKTCWHVTLYALVHCGVHELASGNLEFARDVVITAAAVCRAPLQLCHSDQIRKCS